MSLKNEIEKTMFTEGIEDRIQDIATFMDIPVDDVKKRLKTLTFSDYIEVMTSLKTKN
jgi:predicted ArsR family transcriptional regulator